MKPRTRLVTLILLAASCSPGGRSNNDGGGSGGNGGGGGGNGGGAGGNGGTGGSGGTGGGNPGDGGFVWDGGGPSCGEMTTPLPYAPQTPDVLIAFDKSDSMRSAFGSGTRFTTERDIMVPLVSMFEDRVRWGYLEFPQLMPPMAIVPPDIMNATKVNMAINDCGPTLDTGSPPCDRGSGTPTSTAMMRARTFYAGFVDGIKNRFVLLSTDGEPTNSGGCDAVIPEIDMMLAMGVRTIVLGVSDQVAASPCLDRMAMAGGVPRMGGPPFFYEAKDPALLQAHLMAIVGLVAKPTCTIDLMSAPPDPTRVAVFFDGMQVPWDPNHVDGWDFESGSLTKIIIYGSYCDKLQKFEVMTLDVKFGCRPCGGTVAC